MNTLTQLWQRLTARPSKDPGQPAPQLNELETAILEDYQLDRSKWTFRRYPSGEIRADSRGVTIISKTIHPVNIRPDIAEATASCGALEFGTAFAEQWHKLATDRVTMVERTEKQVAANRVAGELRRVFLE